MITAFSSSLPFATSARLRGLVGPHHERRHAARAEALEKRLHGGTVAIDDDVIGDRSRKAWQLLLETLFEKWNEEDRHNQKKEEDADKLHRDDKDDHRRMLPVAVVAIAGGAQRLGRPLDALPERAMLALQARHSGLI